MKSLLSLFFLLALFSINATTISNDLFFDHTVTDEQRRIIQTDLEYFESLSFVVENQQLATKFGLTSFDSDQLASWLDERLNYFVGESFNLYMNMSVLKISYNHPNAEIPLRVESLSKKNIDMLRASVPVKKDDTDEEQKFYVVASNMGANIYHMSKISKALHDLELSDGTKIIINSPMVGIIQIGEGLLLNKLRVLKEADKEAPVNIIGRVSTYFHEARHSDGIGEGAMFTHAICPLGHDFAGYYACDRNLNGSYTLEYHMLKTLMENCTDCGVKEREALKVRYTSKLNRVLNFDIDMEKLSSINEEIKSKEELLMWTFDEKEKQQLEEEIIDLEEKQLEVFQKQNGPVSNWENGPEGGQVKKGFFITLASATLVVFVTYFLTLAKEVSQKNISQGFLPKHQVKMMTKNNGKLVETELNEALEEFSGDNQTTEEKEHFKQLLWETGKHLPQKDILIGIEKNELHETPEFIQKIGEKFGEIAQVIHAKPHLTSLAVPFYQSCTYRNDLMVSIRAVCLHNLRKLYQNLNLRKRLKLSQLPLKVVLLASRIES